MHSTQYKKRAYIVFFLLFGLFSLVLLRLFYWQVAASERLSGLAQRQRLATYALAARRGSIFATDGSPLVINQRAFLLYAEREKIENTQGVTALLARELQIPEASIAAKLSQQAEWIPIEHKVDESVAERIKKENLKGIGLLDEPKRFYPEASMAAHVLGFVGKNSKGEDQGYFGIEGFYDEQLRGRNGTAYQEADALGHPILAGFRREIPAEDGRSLYLTIDKTVQFIAEKRLKEGIQKYEAKGGTVTILEPKTGAVLAMAAYPSYFPGDFAAYQSEYYKNPIVASTYEPGSTFKVLVMAAAINEGKIKASDTYNEEGPLHIGGFTIKTWNQQYHGVITMPQILQHSSNVGMVFIQEKLGDEGIFSYIQKYGFGDTTGVDLQEETYATRRSKDDWYEIDYATASFGQGIAVTPLQMVRAVAAIANGGKLMRPYVVKKIITRDSRVIVTQPKIEAEVLKREAASVQSEMMVYAVENGETKYLKTQGMRVAGKTGTAQIPIAGHYDAQKTIASFVGFAPSDDPKFVMLVTVTEPTTSPWGSETAAPLFFSIARELLPILSVSS